MTPRAQRVRDAMFLMDIRGEQPSPGKIQRALGETVRNGGDLNGRDTKVYRETMRDLGYSQTHVGARWHR